MKPAHERADAVMEKWYGHRWGEDERLRNVWVEVLGAVQEAEKEAVAGQREADAKKADAVAAEFDLAYRLACDGGSEIGAAQCVGRHQAATRIASMIRAGVNP